MSKLCRAAIGRIVDAIDSLIHDLLTAGIGALECDITMRNGTRAANAYARWRRKPWLIVREPEVARKSTGRVRATTYLPGTSISTSTPRGTLLLVKDLPERLVVDAIGPKRVVVRRVMADGTPSGYKYGMHVPRERFNQHLLTGKYKVIGNVDNSPS